MIKTEEIKNSELKNLFEITADIPAQVVVQNIFKRLFEKMTFNEQGIIADTETEYLHHYRVSIRKIRSAIHLIKEFFSDDIIKPYSQWFSEIAKATNKLRDMDVFLLSEQELKSKLSNEFQNNIDPFFKYIRAERADELSKMRELLTSESYARCKKSWQTFISTQFSALAEGTMAQVPTIQLVNASIIKKYQLIIDMGQDISGSSPYTELHALRIQCKKLHYWLEFFTPLYPDAEIDKATNKLKQLQDSLGHINDLNVQAKYLKAYSQNVDLPKQQTMAIDCLIGELAIEQKQMRLQFRHSFQQFSNSEPLKFIS